MPTRRELFLDRAGIFGSGSSQNFGPDGFSAIVGGAGLVMSSSGEHNVLAGGHDNTISAGDDNSIVGGYFNQLESDYGFMGGGYDNTIFSGAESVATVGGQLNIINTGDESVIVGGLRNTITGGFSAGIFASRDATDTHNRSAMIACDNRASVANNTLHVDNLHVFEGYVSFAGLPTSSTGLAAGRLWVSGTSPNKYVRMA